MVIGAGACGLIAALAAREAGAEVLVLERDSSPSGSTALSSGFIPAAGTRYQAPPASTIRRSSSTTCSARTTVRLTRIVAALCRGIGPTLEWLDDRHGVRFDVLQGFTYPGHSRLRMHAVAEKTGEALMAALLRACADVDILCDARASHVDDEIPALRKARRLHGGS